MSTERWSRVLTRVGVSAERAADLVSSSLTRKLEKDTPLHIIAYRGFGTEDAARISGRVLRYKQTQFGDAKNGSEHADYALQDSHRSASIWDNLRENYARFDTQEVSDVVVNAYLMLSDNSADYATTQSEPIGIQTRTDEEGYFTLTFDTKQLSGLTQSVSDETGIVNVHLSLPDYTEYCVDGDSCIQIPSPHARFGVISDIDDTVLVTEATSVLSMMRLTLLGSVHTRVAFTGVAEFYQALHASINPFFYVSSSPWNLYEFLSDFIRHNGIVEGPLLLRDFGIDETKFIAGSHHDHKLQQIRTVLETHPALTFLLIGDSGQDDPEIYAQIVDEYPDRIMAIYIRDVSGNVRRRSMQALIAKLAEQSVDMLLVPDTRAAARHAAAKGWVDELD